MRRGCTPRLVDADGQPLGLSRVDFSDPAIGEKFLQEQLHMSPSILPVEELDDSFAPLLSLGREILSIDNLFISPAGRITVVETKLWRNPQATREVVAQILEYATRLSALSYDEFERACRRAKQPALLAGGTLFRLVSEQFPGVAQSEPEFTDAVERNLRTARFMLLVVGDGIRENLEDLLGLLHLQPQRLFTFGLVELQIYKCDALAGHLIIPQLVARTTEIVRAVVHVEGRGDVNVSVSLPPEDGVKLTTLSEQEFLNSVKDPEARALFPKLLEFAKEMGGHVHPTKHTVVFRMPFYNTGNIRFFRLFDRGIVRCGRLDAQLLKRGLSADLALSLAKDIAALFPAVGLKDGKPELSRTLKAKEVADKFDDFVSAYRKAIDQLKTMSPTAIPAPDEDEMEEEEE